MLFGKYQLCQVLGRGRSGTVYLAKHKDLDEYRAIKQVPKSYASYERFLQEALILKTIRHPGIPIIYDLEEDDNFSYLIEEFLEGDSIFALISDMGRFSKAVTLQYGIQICRLVYTLHFAKPYPILYLDLQPKNLLVCHDIVKLVDFDHAVSLPEAERLTKRYGTIGCAAPEQYTKDSLDERTDIYAIGAVLYYMLTGTYPGERPEYPKEYIDRRLAKILSMCLRKERTRRYDTVEQLCKELEQILLEEQGVFKMTQESSLTIAVAGAKEGAGTTHIAIGLVAYMKRQGYSVLYEERNDSEGVRQLASCVSASLDSYGIYRIKGISMLPKYGNAVTLEPHSYQIVVCDYGIEIESWAQEFSDGRMLVCPGKPWEWKASINALSSLGTHPRQAMIYNQFCRQIDIRLPSPAKENKVFLMPYHSNPWEHTNESKVFFKVLLSYLFDHDVRGRFLRFKKRILKRNGKP